MSFNWIEPPPLDADFLDPLSRSNVAGQATDPYPWLRLARASAATRYLIYDNGDGTYLSTVITKKGSIDWSDVIKQSSKSLEDAQAACQADWDLGEREKPRPEPEIGSAVVRPGYDAFAIRRPPPPPGLPSDRLPGPPADANQG